MRPDYVVISSDDNPLYLDFLPVVAKQWKEFIGIDVFFLHITDHDSEIMETPYGLCKQIKSIPNVHTGLQAQVSRLYAAHYLPNKNLLTADIDMLPLSKEYFTHDHGTTQDQVLLYTASPYCNVPYHAMCYMLVHGQLLKDILHLPDTFWEFCVFLNVKYRGAWNTDENFLYDCLQNHQEKLVKQTRDTSHHTRISRGNWVYDIVKLCKGWYIDSHLPRPYMQYKREIDMLIKQVTQ